MCAPSSLPCWLLQTCPLSVMLGQSACLDSGLPRAFLLGCLPSWASVGLARSCGLARPLFGALLCGGCCIASNSCKTGKAYIALIASTNGLCAATNLWHSYHCVDVAFVLHCAQSIHSRLTIHALAANAIVAIALRCHLAAILTDDKQHLQLTHGMCLLL